MTTSLRHPRMGQVDATRGATQLHWNHVMVMAQCCSTVPPKPYSNYFGPHITHWCCHVFHCNNVFLFVTYHKFDSSEFKQDTFLNVGLGDAERLLRLHCEDWLVACQARGFAWDVGFVSGTSESGCGLSMFLQNHRVWEIPPRFHSEHRL